jgi:hypothetical protein
MTADSYAQTVETVARAMFDAVAEREKSLIRWDAAEMDARLFALFCARAALAALAIHPETADAGAEADKDLAGQEWEQVDPAPAPAISEGETGWQPIETAPKDGALLIAASQNHNEVEVVRWMPEGADEDGLAHWSGPSCRTWFNERYFTHWMPLPALAAAGQKP